MIANLTFSDLISQHIDHSMKLALSAERYPLWKHSCPELADGHFIGHACHTPKNEKEKVYAAGFIYALNLHYGIIRPLCPVTNGTQKHQKIPILRKHLEKENGNKQQQKSRH